MQMDIHKEKECCAFHSCRTQVRRRNLRHVCAWLPWLRLFHAVRKSCFFRNSVKAGMEVAEGIRSQSESADGFTGRNAM